MNAARDKADKGWRDFQNVMAEAKAAPMSVPYHCPNCFESSGYMARVHAATWSDPAWADSDPMNPCPVCEGTGSVDSEPATLEDLEEMAELEATQPPLLGAQT